MKSELINFQSNGHTTPGYLAQPDDDQAYPGVVVIQEWWGLVDHIQACCERFAQAGFVALAPDLYHGEKTDEPDEARKLVMALNIERALQEIRMAAHHLAGLETVAPKQVGVVGWCMGGMAAFNIAATPGDAPFAAAVGFYGRPPTADQIPNINMPVLGLFGELDEGIPPQTAREFEQALQVNGKTHEIYVYPGAHHAFFNDTRSAYNAAAATDAWEKTLRWFQTYLK